MTAQTAIERDACGRYKGYHVSAIDGTELQLPKNEEILQKFTQRKGSSLPHARASVLCDVITGFTIHACIDTTKVGERVLAMEHLQYFQQYNSRKDIVIFDRGYPSKALIKYFENSATKYLMRFPRSFNAEIDSTNKKDFYVKIDGCNVRVVKLNPSNIR